MVVLLWILNQIAIQVFHIAIADCSITVQEELRKHLEIRKLNNFYSYSADERAGLRLEIVWLLATLVGRLHPKEQSSPCSFAVSPVSSSAWSAPLICWSAVHLSLHWQVQFNCSCVHSEVVNTNRILDNKEADVNLYEVLSVDKYELERFYWTSILNISVKLHVILGRHMFQWEICFRGVCVSLHFSFQQNCKQEQEYLLLSWKWNLWNICGEKTKP